MPLTDPLRDSAARRRPAHEFSAHGDVAVAIDLRLGVSGESSEELMSRPIRVLRVLLPYSTITNVAWAATILQPVSAS
jgi:hypothetical protein